MLRLLALLVCLVAVPAGGVTLAPGDIVVNQPQVHRVVSPGVTELVVPAPPSGPIAGDLTVSGSTVFAAAYAVSLPDTGDSILRVDDVAGTATQIGGYFVGETISDLVADPDGVLYALSGSSAGQRLYRVNSSTGARDLLFTNNASSGPFAGLNLGGVSFLDQGTAVFVARGASVTGGAAVFSYDLASGATTLLAAGGLMVQPFPPNPGALPGPLVVAPNGTILVAAFSGLQSYAVEIDPATGSQRFVGFLHSDVRDLEISADGRTLYAGVNNPRIGSSILALDVATGTSTTIFSGPTGIVTSSPPGLAIVPEPATAALLGFGLAALAARRSRR